MDEQQLTSLIKSLGKAGLNVTINNHYGTGDIRSGTEITVNHHARQAPPRNICPSCGIELYSAWDVSDGGLCRPCAQRQIKLDRARRADQFLLDRQSLDEDEQDRADALIWIDQQRDKEVDEYESVPVIDNRTGRIIGSETRRRANIIDGQTGRVIGSAPSTLASRSRDAQVDYRESHCARSDPDSGRAAIDELTRTRLGM